MQGEKSWLQKHHRASSWFRQKINPPFHWPTHGSFFLFPLTSPAYFFSHPLVSLLILFCVSHIQSFVSLSLSPFVSFPSPLFFAFNPFSPIFLPFVFMPFILFLYSHQWEWRLLSFPSFLMRVNLTVSPALSALPFGTIHAACVALTIYWIWYALRALPLLETPTSCISCYFLFHKRRLRRVKEEKLPGLELQDDIIQEEDFRISSEVRREMDS